MPKVSDESILAWLGEHDIRNERGEPIDLKSHFFLYDIYRDFSPFQVGYKAAQVGWTTMATLKNFFLAEKKKIDSIYTVPTQNDVYSLVGTKVNRIIAANAHLKSLVANQDSMERKQVGSNIIYYRGTMTEREALMVSSDLNIHDEEDRSDQSVVQQYRSRLQHSQYKWEWHFSNPSVEGNGVSRYWSESDQKHWFITCEKCKKEQFLMWPESIDVERQCYQCKFCHEELSDEDRRVGRWVAKVKGKSYSGYWINLMMTVWTPASDIIKLYNTKSKEYFWNFVLGLPYVGEGNKVTPDIIYRNLTKTLNKKKSVVIGVDSGIVKHFVCGNEQGLFRFGKTEKWGDIESLLSEYEDSMVVIDAMPDITGPRMLQDEYPGRVFLCHYARDRKTQQIVRWGQNEELGNVLVDRNRAIQMVVDEFADRRIPLQGSRDDWSEYYSHWDTLYRVTEDDTLGVPQISWMTSNGIDHWAHACFAGDTMIVTDKGEVPIKDIKVGDYVVTRSGFEEVIFSGLIKKKAEVIERTFENGRTIVATPDHEFWTENQGWKELQNVSMNDILVGIWNNTLTEKLIDSIEESGTCAQRKGCIEMFGNFITEIYRRACIFTTKIAIRLTTPLVIWSWSIGLHTLANTLATKFSNPLCVKCAELGINAKTRAIINTVQSGAGQSSTASGTIKWRGNVSSVKNDLPPIHIGGVSHVLKTVRMKRTVKAKKEGQSQEIFVDGFQVKKDIKYPTNKEDVYGITVGDSHEYFANGILVANSVYWRVGMDKYGFGKAEIIEPKVRIAAPSGPEIDPYGKFRAVTKTGEDPVKATLDMLAQGEDDDWRNI